MVKVDQKILSDIIVHMKYARYVPQLQRRETWEELVTRNMNMHIEKFPHLETNIRENYKFVFDKKILPSMRSLQFGGTPIQINEARGYNCSYLPINHYKAFPETMFLLLSGCGVGFSVQRHHVEELPEINKPKKGRKRFVVDDSIIGWADSVKHLMKSYFSGGNDLVFDYRDIRPKGARLITAGGKAPGPEPLRLCIEHIRAILNNKQDGEKLSPIEVHSIICHIADAVLAGGIRRICGVA
jgi:ribonucleoside-diphosphate reductase alpha chain